jgi:Methyltransferase domain
LRFGGGFPKIWVQMTEAEFEKKLNELDTGLFAQIRSESTELDKRSLLAIQAAVRRLVPGYTYLEVGSYLGGSIQPHLLDPECRTIWSIDKRPPSQPDARGYDWAYNNNSTERMLEMLRGVADDISKVKTLDGDTRSISAGSVTDTVDLCFIDGEHTDAAALADFRFCLDVLAGDGAIVFHDAHIVYNAIAEALEILRERGKDFRSYVLPHTAFVIEIGDFPLLSDERVLKMAADNSHSFLFALKDNDQFRRFANRFPFGALRRTITRLRSQNVSE